MNTNTLLILAAVGAGAYCLGFIPGTVPYTKKNAAATAAASNTNTLGSSLVSNASTALGQLESSIGADLGNLISGNFGGGSGN